MADVYFNLAAALESYKPDSVEAESTIKIKEHDAECDQHSGIDIEVVDEPHNMRQVVNLVIALHRLKKTQKLQGTEFSDEELCNIFFENVVEEYVTPTVHQKTTNAADHYDSSEQPQQKSFICDVRNKFLVLSKGITTELQAITLQSGNKSRRVQLELTTYKPSVTPDKGRPIALGVGEDLYLSCTSSSGKPVLGLEVVKKEDLKSISGDMKRFLFNKTVSGQTVTSFESVKYKGYFISTSYTDGQRVDMCQSQDVPDRLTSFTLV
ncbi:interleukin-1 beta-like isoform X1 [Alosa sapidissima]|uniref:interleukin-1 beta-like isoform X1 n=2 Tax=Alosa sapidissima TaxID=34773 RepID=UPI001C0A63C7|nr:interleukin-1 beta-like isoform X1 [Alosa sapidissima]